MKLVPYYRVSTKRQGDSGLGLEAQQAAVNQFASAKGATVLKSYTEVESGKRADRPQLTLALSIAKWSKATLVVAKLDRLSRNVAFLSALMDSGADFIACDNPHANRLTLHILIAVAEDEAKRISERTVAALAAYKARGGVLGSARPECRNNLNQQARERGLVLAAEARIRNADEAYADLYTVLLAMRPTHTLQQIADHLNAQGYLTRTGKVWNKQQVSNCLDRATRLLGH